MRLGEQGHQPAVLKTGAVLAVITALAAGCGGGGNSKPGASSAQSNSEAVKPSVQVAVDAKAAAVSARSVHVSGRVPSTSGLIELNFTLAGTKAKGTFAHNGQIFSIVRVGNVIYIRGNKAFWRHIGGSRAVAVLRGRWLKTPATNVHFRRLAGLTHVKGFVDLFLKKPMPNELGNGGVKTYRGQPVVALYETLRPFGTFYVKSVGKPYPVAVVFSGKRQYTLSFGQWNQPVSVTAPKNAIDVSRLRGTTRA